MSWLFSQALAVEFWPESCSDGELSAQSNGNPTQLAYLPPDRMTAFSRLSRFGMTFKALTADRGAELLTLYLAAFRAKTSALQERAQASPESAAECGDTWRGSLARFDPDTSSWKTVQHSLLEDSESCLVIWPRSGMTVDGQCWELPTLGRRISATGSGLWPTPQTRGFTNDGDLMALGRMCDSYQEMSAMAYRAAKTKKKQYWPTPCATDAHPFTGGELYTTKTGTVRAMRPDGTSSNRGLAATVQKWPTPTARCHKGGGNSMTRKDGKSRSDMLDWVVEYQTGMRLNPMWVEWLMGWPLGWTDLKPLETDKCQPAQQQRGDC